jgi:hypothetical protein
MILHKKGKLTIAKSKSSQRLSVCHWSQYQVKYLDMKQICQILWCPLFEFIRIYQVDIIVKIMVVDLSHTKIENVPLSINLWWRISCLYSNDGFRVYLFPFVKQYVKSNRTDGTGK